MRRAQVLLGPQVTTDQRDKIKNILDNLHISLVTNNPDFYLIAGGDGTFLAEYHLLEDRRIPIFGVNLGHLGFFMESTMDKLSDDLAQISMGYYKIESYSLLDATIETTSDVIRHTCVNDFVIRGCGPSGEVTFGATKFDVYVDGVYLETAFGDGFIVASPAGSTAYNRSAHGAMIHPQVHAYELTELPNVNSSSWRSFDRPVILSDQKLKIVPRGTAAVGSDGKLLSIGFELIDFRMSSEKVSFIRTKDFNFFKPLQKSFLNNVE